MPQVIGLGLGLGMRVSVRNLGRSLAEIPSEGPEIGRITDLRKT